MKKILTIIIIFIIISVSTLSKEQDKFLKKIQIAMNVQDSTTSVYARRLASKYAGEYNLKQVFGIYKELRNNWKYVNDPRGIENFSKASDRINAGLSGDCDDFAILMATLIESVGGRTRVTLAYNNDNGHAFTEVYIGRYSKELIDYILKESNKFYSDLFSRIYKGGSVNDIFYRTDRNGNVWLNLDWTAKHPGGEYYSFLSSTIYYPREGYYEISGPLVGKFGQLIFYEEFNNNRNRWDVFKSNNSYGEIVNGYYLLVSKNGAWITNDIKYINSNRNYQIEMLINLGAEKSSTGGMILNFKDSKNYEIFIISNYGCFSYGKVTNGEYYKLYDWTNSNTINGKKYNNLLKLKKIDNSISLYVNEKKVGEIYGENNGKVQFGMTAFGTIIVDNIKIFN